MKSEAITKLNALGQSVAANATDAAVIAAFNALSDEEEAKFKKEVVYCPSVSPKSLSFAKTADNTGKTVTVTSNTAAHISAATVTSEQAWITPTISGKTITVKVAANSESDAPKRTGSVLLTIDGRTATIAVEQAANA